ncbi:MAG: tetratricopeptide repeat protein [Candidatus Hodarchaeales archaeon]
MSDQLAFGRELIRGAENEKAIKILKKVVEADPQNPEGYRHLGLAYSNIGEYSKALDSWNRCLDLDPEHHQTWWNLGQLHDSMGDFKNAFHAYTKAETTVRDSPSKASRYNEWALKAKRKIKKD